MLTASPTTRPDAGAAHPAVGDAQDVVETRLWIDEHEWVFCLLRSDANVSPTFRIPDLISACVSIVFAQGDAVQRVFAFLGAELVLRDPSTPRRRESMWRAQYELLHDLQCSPANRHPNPKFQLDQLTTTCVALCKVADASGAAVLLQARQNMAERQRRSTAAHLR